jgi:hypothetical protein
MLIISGVNIMLLEYSLPQEAEIQKELKSVIHTSMD